MGSSSYLGGKSVEKSSLRRSVENYDGKGSSSSVSSIGVGLKISINIFFINLSSYFKYSSICAYCQL